MAARNPLSGQHDDSVLCCAYRSEQFKTPLTETHNRTANTEQTKVQKKRCLKAHITCIVLEVLDLHGRLGCAVAKTPVLLQQLQTFISVINWTPTVVRTQHFNR